MRDIFASGVFFIWNVIGEKVGEEIGEGGLVMFFRLYFFVLFWIGLEENCFYNKNR